MSTGQQPIPGGGEWSQYNLSAVTGMNISDNPWLNIAGGLLVNHFNGGRGLFPRPSGTNSVFEAILQQQRNYAHFKIRNQQLAGLSALSRFGLNMDPNGMATAMLSDPNGIVMRALSPIIGGNPLKAQMGLYANMQGLAGAGFGYGPFEVSPSQTSDMINDFEKYFYNHRGSMSPNDARRLYTAQGGKLKPGEAPPDYNFVYGQNWNNNMGFKYEDLTGASARMGNVNMWRGPMDYNKFFTGGANKVLDASRSLFGSHLSGSELVSELSSFTGKDYFNLSDSTHTQKLEDLLRTVKATSRVLNVDLGLMKQLVESFQALGDQKGIVGGIGLTAATGFSQDALTKIAGLKATGGDAYIRRMGGETAMLATISNNSMDSLNQPGAKMLGAIYTRFTGDSAMQKLVTDYMQTGDMSASGINRFVNRMARPMGMTPFEAMYYVNNNTAAGHAGLKDMEEATPGIASEATARMAMAQIGMQIDSAYHKPGMANALFKAAYNPDLQGAALVKHFGGNKDLVRIITQARSRAAGGKVSMADLATYVTKANAAPMLSFTAQGFDVSAMNYLDPNMRAFRQIQREVITGSKQLETAYSNKMSQFNAPVITQLADMILANEFTTEGFKKRFAMTDAEVNSAGISGNVAQLEAIGKAKGDTDIENIFNKSVNIDETSVTRDGFRDFLHNQRGSTDWQPYIKGLTPSQKKDLLKQYNTGKIGDWVKTSMLAQGNKLLNTQLGIYKDKGKGQASGFFADDLEKAAKAANVDLVKFFEDAKDKDSEAGRALANMQNGFSADGNQKVTAWSSTAGKAFLASMQKRAETINEEANKASKLQASDQARMADMLRNIADKLSEIGKAFQKAIEQ